MTKKLDDIYNFLTKNRGYNKDLQEKHYRSVALCYRNVEDKVASFLYEAVNSQSQPKIDKLSIFYRFIHEQPKALTSFQKFVKRISKKDNGSYCDLYIGLKNCDGWGPKTSALFVKTIFHLHNNKYAEELRLWDDAPSFIAESDRLYLPVDTVIIKIFDEMHKSKKWSFISVNNEISKSYKGAEVEVWDDLWFWGFITQKVENKNRVLEWNPNKYWSLKHSNKNEEVIKEIEEKANIFLSLLRQENSKSSHQEDS